MNIDEAIASHKRTGDHCAALFSDLAINAFENLSNGRLSGAYMRVANAHRKFAEEVTDALKVIKEETEK